MSELFEKNNDERGIEVWNKKKKFWVSRGGIYDSKKVVLPLDEFFDDYWVIFLFLLMKIIIGEWDILRKIYYRKI